MTSALEHRRDLADALVTAGTVRSAWLQRAFEDTPRETFVPRFYRSESGRKVLVDGTNPRQREQWLHGVYTDEPLTIQLTPAPDSPTGPGLLTSSSSMPTVMAGMLEALDLRPGHRVLEIGTGTGYNAALLCHRVGAANVTSIELDARLADAARRALTSIGLAPTVHTGGGAAGFALAAPFDRIIVTAATDHIPPSWISQLAPGGVMVVDLRGSLAGSLLRLTAMDCDVVEGTFLNLPGAFMSMRTHVDNPHRDSERWDRVFDHRNPQRGTTAINPSLVADIQSLRFMAQLHLAGRRLRGFLRPLTDSELSGRCTDGSWFTAGLHPIDDDGLFPVEQGGPQRLWDTVESCHASWKRLDEPDVEQFGVTAYDDVALQYIWLDHPDSYHRWPLPL